MFTGIVEETGRVTSVPAPGRAGRLAIKASRVLEGTRIGDSIAVNGVCLTATELLPDGFAADVMPQTLSHSNLGALRAGSPVNLERAMAADGRFGGHIVSGHIDGTGTVRRVRRDQNAVRFTIGAPAGIMALIVAQGSITVDGISLTVADLYDDAFEVSVIPHTAAETTRVAPPRQHSEPGERRGGKVRATVTVQQGPEHRNAGRRKRKQARFCAPDLGIPCRERLLAQRHQPLPYPATPIERTLQ